MSVSFFIQAVIQISNNLMGSKLDQDPSSLFSPSSIHLCNSNSNWTFIALNLSNLDPIKLLLIWITAWIKNSDMGPY